MTKRILAALMALILLAGCVPALATSYMIFPTGPLEVEPTPAPTAKPAVFVEFKGDATIYKKAGKDRSEVIILAGSVAQAKSLSKDKKWVKIYYGPNNTWTGWVRAAHLKKASIQYAVINYKPKDSGTARGDLRSAARKLSGRRFTVRVNTKVYSTGSSSGKSLGRLKKGLKVTATGGLKVDSSGVFFVQVTYKGRTGWVPETSLRGAAAAITGSLTN